MSDTITRRDAFHVLDDCRFASEQEKKYAYSLMEQVASADVKDTNDTIYRQAAIDSLGKGLSKIPYMNNTDADMIRRDERICCIQEVRELPSAQPPVLTCDGCRHVGTYDTDFPCSGCIRREKDYYEQER